MIRIGFAKDIHRIVNDRDFILGGVKIEANKGLLGHSDADVLLHAIAEALLGSLALGDLGKHFPDTDEKFLDFDSSIILKEVYKMIKERGFGIVNIDASIELESIKLAKYIDIIRKNIADLLQINIEQISVKAMTREGLDSVGKGEACVAYATVLVTDEKN